MPSLAAWGIGAGVAGLASYFSGKSQQSAAQKAQQASAQQIADATQSGQRGYGSAEGTLFDAAGGAQGNINQGYNQSTDYLTQGLGAQRGDLLDSGNLGANAVTTAQGNSLGDLYGGASTGIGYLNGAQTGVDQALNSGLSNAQAALGGRASNAQDLLNQPGGLYGSYQQSPGYQFALEQGEQGINRAAAAAGGRYSGATLKALGQFDTGLANQDYQNYAQNQQALLSGSLGVDNNSLSANSTLAGLYGSAGSQSASTAAGLGSQAAQLAYGAGQGAAGIDQGAGNSLADIYGRTGTQLAGADAGAGTALAQNASNYYGNLNSLGMGVAQQLGNDYIGAGNVEAGILGANIQNNQSTIPYAGSSAAAIGNTANTLAQGVALSSLYGGGGPGYTGYSPGSLPQTQAQLDQFGGGPIQ